MAWKSKRCLPIDESDALESNTVVNLSQPISSDNTVKNNVSSIFNSERGNSRCPHASDSCIQSEDHGLHSDIDCKAEILARPHGTDEQTSMKLEYESLLQDQYRISMSSLTRYDSNQYSSSYWKGKMVEIATCRAADGSMWDTSHPFASLLCKQWFCKLLVSAICCLLISFALYLTLILERNVVKGYRFRFKVLELRCSTDYKFAKPAIKKLGFMKNSCGKEPVDLPFNQTLLNDGGVALLFPEPIELNGWWFVTEQHSIEYDPIRFVLEYSKLPSGEVWEQIGSSSWTWTWSGSFAWENGFYPTATGRNATEFFDISVPWVWTLHRLSSCAVLMVMVMLLLIVITKKHHFKGKWIVILFCSFNAILNGAACILYLLSGQWKVAFVAGGFFVLDWGIPTILLFSETTLRVWLGIAGLAYPIIILVHYILLVKQPAKLFGYYGRDLSLNVGFLEGMGYFGLFLCAYFKRRQSRKTASEIIQQDYANYDRCWWELVQNDDNCKTFKEMKIFTDQICPSQLNMVKQPRNIAGLDHNVEDKGTKPFDHGCIIYRLEQLFAQAAGLDIVLRHKIQGWALLTKGYFPIGEILSRWDYIKQKGLKTRVRWAKLKSRDRALEKVYRSYKLDASRLLDCCRQSIYFKDVDSLFQCLQLICIDPSIKIARICNRLHDAYDTSATAGYRDVLLNLSIATEETKQLHIDRAVCELQLTLVDFAVIKVLNPVCLCDLYSCLYTQIG